MRRFPAALRRDMTVRQRLSLIVLAVALPMLLLSAGIVWHLDQREREARRDAATLASRAILTAVDAQVGKYPGGRRSARRLAVAARADLAAFRAEAERAMPALPSGSWVTLAVPGGQQVLNTLVSAATPLPLLAPEVREDEVRAFATQQFQVTGAVIGPVAKAPVAGVGVPVYAAASLPISCWLGST